MAKIAQSAIAALRISSLNTKKIEKTMARQSDERDQELDRCDQLFYKAQTQQSVSKRLYGFIKANKTHIDF